jgi:hypothetical protein
MRKELGFEWLLVGALTFCALLFGLFFLLRGEPEERPYLKILGASFIFNYRVSDVYMGFAAAPQKPIPIGSILTVSFENPAGGDPFIVNRQIGLPDRRISLRSPSMRGVKAHIPYKVHLQLSLPDRDTAYWQHEFSISSNSSDDIVPDKPLVVGPGYHRPEDLRKISDDISK